MNASVNSAKPNAQEILRVVPFEKGFHFTRVDGTYTGVTAVSLTEFGAKLQTIDVGSIEFHFRRQDFQKWMRTTLIDEELASRLDKIPASLDAEELKKTLIETVLARLAELQKASNTSNRRTIPEVAAKSSEAQLRKFTLEEVKSYNGRGGKSAYVVFEGKVFDVTGSSFWQEGNHFSAHQAGKDLTAAIKSAPHGGKLFSRVKQVGVLA